MWTNKRKKNEFFFKWEWNVRHISFRHRCRHRFPQWDDGDLLASIPIDFFYFLFLSDFFFTRFVFLFISFNCLHRFVNQMIPRPKPLQLHTANFNFNWESHCVCDFCMLFSRFFFSHKKYKTTKHYANKMFSRTYAGQLGHIITRFLHILDMWVSGHLFLANNCVKFKSPHKLIRN